MSAQILKHPAVTAEELRNARLRHIYLAIFYSNKGDENNRAYCLGVASGLDRAISALGGDSISMKLSDYER